MRASLPGILLLLGSYALVSQSAAAQEDRRPQPKEEWRVQQFTMADGLPDSRVASIQEDSLGFLWLGTLAGLVRFDGHHFENFRPSRDSTSIGGSSIWALEIDEKGDVWAGDRWSVWGLSRFDRHTERFTTYRHDERNPNSLVLDGVRAIYQSTHESGAVWISGQEPTNRNSVVPVGGLSRFHGATGSFTNYVYIPGDSSTGPYLANAILEDPSGTLWGGGFGLNRLALADASNSDSLRQSVITYLPDPEAASGEKGWETNGLNTLYAAPTEPGVLWAGGYVGLHRFDLATESFSTYFPFPVLPLDPRNSVHALLEDQDGTLWVGTSDGLFTFDRLSRRFNRFEHFPDLGVDAIEEDRFGVLWIGSQGGGLWKLERRLNPFTLYQHVTGNSNSLSENRVLGIREDSSGDVWIATRNRMLNRIDRSSGVVVHYPGRFATTIVEDQAGMLWLPGCSEGLGRMNPEEPESFFIFQPDPDAATSFGNCANPVLEDLAGHLWVTTYGHGLSLLDREKGIFTRFENDPNDLNSLGNNNLLRAYESPLDPGVIWLGSEGGLIRFEPETKTFTNYLLDDLRRSMMMLEDRKGRFWVATGSNGLHLFDRKAGTVEHTYTTDDGLPNNQIWSVYEDNQGFLWLGTSSGLSRFNPETETFKNFTTRDGLPDDAFDEQSHYQSPSGELFFGTDNGAVSFFPDQVVSNPIPPEVVLTGLRIANAPVEIGPEAPLKTSLGFTETITLPYAQNDLTFEYVGLHSIAPDQTRYRYQLEGYDADWIDAGTMRAARYQRLPPDDYLFRVRAISGDGVWSEEDASVRITILPPWWRTWWAYVLYGCLCVAGIVGLGRIQRNRVVEREREKTRERELAHAREIESAYSKLKSTQQQLIQSEKMASLGQLTAGIAHEIKNPLNFVNNFAELNAELVRELEDQSRINPELRVIEIADELAHIKLNAAQVARHGKRADQIVQSMMQHASTGRGERFEVALNPLVEEYIALTYSSQQARRPDLEVTIEKDLDPSAGSLTIAPREIGRVLQNILANAFEAVYEKARSAGPDYAPIVWVETIRGEDYVEIRVKDNGMGIPRGARDRVFEPFFTTKPAGSGTGLGLSLSYDIVVKGHGGSLTVEGEEGEGALFLLRLPKVA